MIQIAFGVLVLVGALIILTGAGDMLGATVDLFPLIGFGGTGLIIGAGLLLIVQGIYGLRLRRAQDGRHALRSAGLAFALVICIGLVVLVLPLGAEAMNLVTIAGFPLGFFVAAQGALGLLFLLMIAWVRWQDRIDAVEGGDE